MGKFITFEGCEGVGKSSQVKMLKEFLEKNNVDCVVTREPGGAGIAESIRNVILNGENGHMCDKCELLLYSAARAQHIQEVIAPALGKGQLVVCDRYIDSTYAYQGVARGMGDYVKKINDLVVGDYLPNLTIFLKLSPEETFKRKGGADKNDRLEQMGIDFHKKVYEGYLQLAETEKRFKAIDASGSRQETHEKIIKLLCDEGVI